MITVIEIEREIQSAVKGLGSYFCGNELAYLALTSKPELVIRDRLAYDLHRRLFPQFLVAREYKRADIAILKDGSPIIALELKTWSLFTFINKCLSHFSAAAADN